MSLINRMLKGTDKAILIEVLTKMCESDMDLTMKLLQAIAISTSAKEASDPKQTDIEEVIKCNQEDVTKKVEVSHPLGS